MECDYCKETGEEIATCNDENAGVYRSGDCFKLFFEDIFLGNIEKTIKFDYCPMCGQKLEE